MFSRLILRCALALLPLAVLQSARAAFDLQFTIIPGSFSAPRQALLLDAIADAEALWEGVITGYQPGISLNVIPISVGSDAGGNLAVGGPTNCGSHGGFQLCAGGQLHVNPATIDAFVSWTGVPGPVNPPPQYLGLNYLDDIVAHEIGHALGIGTLWEGNGVYSRFSDPFHYRGQYGLAAYRQEFDPNATFVPVENAGGAVHSHWDQIMRSSAEEGNPPPLDPWILDPRVGIVGPNGRDFASELMTGALDPDYGEPFLSFTTIQSLRDLGYTVVPEPAGATLFALAAGLCFGIRKLRRE